MTEKQAPYMEQIANTVSAPRTVMFSFTAEGLNKYELRRDVRRIVNGLQGTLAACFPGCIIGCVLQFQVSEARRLFSREGWCCDLYVLAEIVPEPTALNQRLMTAAWKQADAELEALGDESPDVVAGMEAKNDDPLRGESLRSNW